MGAGTMGGGEERGTSGREGEAEGKEQGSGHLSHLLSAPLLLLALLHWWAGGIFKMALQ